MKYPYFKLKFIKGYIMRVIMITLVAVLIVPGCTWIRDAAHRSSSSLPLHVIDTRTPQELRELFRYTDNPLHVISAHRGGAGRKFSRELHSYV